MPPDGGAAADRRTLPRRLPTPTAAIRVNAGAALDAAALAVDRREVRGASSEGSLSLVFVRGTPPRSHRDPAPRNGYILLLQPFLPSAFSSLFVLSRLMMMNPDVVDTPLQEERSSAPSPPLERRSIRLAAEAGCVTLLRRLLLEQPPPPQQESATAAHTQSGRGGKGAAPPQQAVAHAAPVVRRTSSSSSFSALHTAALRGRAACVRLLLAAGADADGMNWVRGAGLLLDAWLPPAVGG